MSDGTHRTAGVLIFSIYLIVYLGILMAHLIALTLSNRHNFYLVIRGRLMLSLELILNGVISTAIALRQVFKEAGWDWPCSLSTLAMTLTFTAYIGTYLLRALVLITIFDQRWRAKYRVLLTTRSLLGIWSTTLAGGIIAWAIVNGRQLCHSLCTQPNCYMGSNYYFALCYNPIALSSITLAALKLRNLSIDERLGIRTELLNCVRASAILVVPYYFIVILQDWDHAMDWYYDWICTASGLAIFLSQFIFTQFFPSSRYGYSPWSRRVIRDSREAYRNMFKAAVSGGFTSPKSQASIKRLDDDTRTMQDIVGHETLRGALARFCRSCLCEELALFVIRMHTYTRVLNEEPAGYTSERAARLRKDLVKRFIREGAVYELYAAIPPDLREKVLSACLRILRADRPPLLSRLLLGRLTTDPLPRAMRSVLPFGLLRGTTEGVKRQTTLPTTDPEVEDSMGRPSSCSSSDAGLPPMPTRHGGSFLSTNGLNQSMGMSQTTGLGQSANDYTTEPLEELNQIVLNILTCNIMEAFKASRPYIKALEAYNQTQQEKQQQAGLHSAIGTGTPTGSVSEFARSGKRGSALHEPSPVARIATVS